jgi:hypothetical protein
MRSNHDDRVAQAITATRRAISDIRTMLWAGDHDSAHSVINQVRSEFHNELSSAEELRHQVIKLEREIRGDIPVEEKTISIGKIRAMDAASKKSGKFIGEKSDYFSLGVLGSILNKLEKRISENTDARSKETKKASKRRGRKSAQQLTFIERKENLAHQIMGFKYLLILIDDHKVECRAYKSGDPRLSLQEVEKNLIKIDKLKIQRWDTAIDIHGQNVLPYRYRGFSEEVYIELTIHDLDRIKIYVVAEKNVDVEAVLRLVIHAFE